LIQLNCLSKELKQNNWGEMIFNIFMNPTGAANNLALAILPVCSIRWPLFIRWAIIF